MIWVLEGRAINSAVSDAIAGPAQAVVSAATVWEIAIKRRLGKLRGLDDPIGLVDDSRMERLPITFEHAERAGTLPLHHRDPFDRMLVAQAQLEGLTLITTDRKMHLYEVPILDAQTA